ncbi:hypothetical protein HDU98_011186 [Podochytrium sp. JEL0797]|nr:hypothetical protein HDU98_011186 [Podochytrium sp. JEL0797]
MQRSLPLLRDRVTLVNPVDAFNRRMALLRNRYRGEAILDAKEAAMEHEAQRAAQAARDETVRQDILAFKRAQRFDVFGGEDAASQKDAVRDALLGVAPSASARATSANANDTDSTSAYVAKRKTLRHATEAARQAQLAARREHALLYLLYAADSFVTKTNLDKRINECLEFGNSQGTKADFAGRSLDYTTLARLARQKLDSSDLALMAQSSSQIGDHGADDFGVNAADNAFSVERFINFGKNNSASPSAPTPSSAPTHTHATMFTNRLSSTRGTRVQIGADRRTILADVAMGTVLGREGPDAIRESVRKMKEQEGKQE